LGSLFVQIGNVAIFLEKGVDSDHYDFLELYIQQWMKAARLIRDSCKKRELFVDDRGYEEWLAEASPADQSSSEDLLRKLAVGPTPVLSLPYFNREFHVRIPMIILVNSAAETIAIYSNILVFRLTALRLERQDANGVLLSI
jgi:hypothetical protein